MTDPPETADGDEIWIAPSAEGDWAALPGVRLGAFGGEAEGHVLVSRDGRPALRLELATPAGEYCFQRKALRWRGWIVVGCDEGVWFVPEDGGEPRRHRLSMYFSAFHAGLDFLLAASGENVTRFGPAGDVVWRSPPVAVDGVNIYDVDADGDRVEGHGEWDPPGGWRPFRRADRRRGEVLVMRDVAMVAHPTGCHARAGAGGVMRISRVPRLDPSTPPP